MKSVVLDYFSIELGTLIDTIVQQLMLWKSRVIIGFATTTVPYSGLPQLVVLLDVVAALSADGESDSGDKRPLIG